MLETVDLDKRIGKAAYEKAFKPLRDQLDDLQRAVYESKIPVAIVFEGWDAAGKGDAIEKLVGRLDPRGYQVHSIFAASEEEKQRPFMWRFWSRIPGRGRIAIFDRSWYFRLLYERVEGDLKKRDWLLAFDEITRFERTLTDDGVVLVKFWLHISEKEQRKRFKTMEASKYESWRVTRDDWKAHKLYQDYHEAAEQMLERSHTSFAPWTIVEATDKYYRRTRIFKTLIDTLQNAVNQAAEAKAESRRRASVAVPALSEARTILDEVDLSKQLSEEEYDEELKKSQVRLNRLALRCYEEKKPVVIACEGWDAAGKGGAIKRMVGCLDPRGYSVIPIAAPQGDEATHHYLWRFWTRIPRAGHIAIFDRTWYGRVLVERVEGFARDDEWRRAYQEINEFEMSLANYGMVIVKLWFHISPEVQLERFRDREQTEHKRYKITAEDWRNREKYDLYRAAVADMLANTSTTWAPWTIVEANDKLWARIRTMKTVAEAIEAALGDKPKKRKKGRRGG